MNDIYVLKVMSLRKITDTLGSVFHNMFML